MRKVKTHSAGYIFQKSSHYWRAVPIRYSMVVLEDKSGPKTIECASILVGSSIIKKIEKFNFISDFRCVTNMTHSTWKEGLVCVGVVSDLRSHTHE
jgi:hypothetical protein